MKSSRQFVKWLFLPFLILTISHLPKANSSNTTTPHSHGLDRLVNQFIEWRQHKKEPLLMEVGLGSNTIAALVLGFLAAAISSAGGTGGGPLYIPILNVVAGLDMKTAASYSAFMVTGSLLSNVLCNFLPSQNAADRPLNYDIALLSQPLMLLGVSLGVICNIMFPDWLITVLFTVVVAYSTYRTCESGQKRWKKESEVMKRSEVCRLESGGDGEDENGINQPLLDLRQPTGQKMSCKDIVSLVLVFIFFLLLHLFIGDKHGKGVISIKPCGVTYWLINLLQVPFAIVFTLYIVNDKRNIIVLHSQQTVDEEIGAKTGIKVSPLIVFPLLALAVGVLGGLFGVGGGLLLSPALLLIGLPPQSASATSTFTLLFSAMMTMVQYIILGMKEIKQASIYAVVCFVASGVGLVVTKAAINKLRRESLIIFAVALVLALSTVVITISGAFDVWGEYSSGEYMGFRPPC